MKKIINKINKESFYEILQYLLMFIIILECNSIYSQVYGYHLIIRATMTGIAILSIIFLIILKKNQIKIHKPIIGFIIYDVLCSLIMFINTDSFSGKGIIVLVFFMFLPLLQIYLSNLTKTEFRDLFQKFVNIVVMLSIISLIFWILSAVFDIIKFTNIIKVVWGKPYSLIDSYYNLHFYTQDVWWITGTPLMRNTGIYTEGPMYALILIVALIFNNLLCFEKSKKNLIKTIILFITMLTTISVTGVVCSIIIILYEVVRFILSLKDVKIKKIIISVLIIFTIAMILAGTPLLSKKMSTGSAVHRNMDIQIGLNTFLENPLLGKGINHERPTEYDYTNGYGYSNSIIPVLTDGGIILGLMYIVPMVLMIIESIKSRKINYIVFLVIFIILLFTTLIQYRLIMQLMICISYYIATNKYFKERDI